MRFNYKDSATVYRLGAYSGGKSEYSVVSGTIHGFLRPISPTQATQNLGVIGQPYEFTTDGHKDVRTNDRIVVSSITYLVRGVAPYRLGSIDNLVCTCDVLNNE